MRKWWLVLFLFILFGVVVGYFNWKIPNKSGFSFGPNKDIAYGIVESNIPSGRLEIVRCSFWLKDKIWCYRGEKFLGIIKNIEGVELDNQVMIVERNQKKVETSEKNISEFLVEKSKVERNKLLDKDLLLGISDNNVVTMIVYVP